MVPGAEWIGLLAISVPTSSTLLSHIPSLLLFSIFLSSDLWIQVSSRFFKGVVYILIFVLTV